MGTWKYSVNYRQGVVLEVTADTKQDADNTAYAFVNNALLLPTVDDQGKVVV